MASHDPEYYARRARECRQAAVNAKDPAVQRVHLDFAWRYADVAADPRGFPGGSADH